MENSGCVDPIDDGMPRGSNLDDRRIEIHDRAHRKRPIIACCGPPNVARTREIDSLLAALADPMKLFLHDEHHDQRPQQETQKRTQRNEMTKDTSTVLVKLIEIG